MIFSVSHISANVSDMPKFSLEKISFTLSKGEILALVGESGAGKSSLLNVIAGFIPVQKGKVTLGKKLLSSAQKTIEPSARSVAYIFQKENLLPYLSLYDNLTLGLPKHTVLNKYEEINHLIQQLGVNHLRNKFPDEVSGGQQQRIALGRALLNDKELLLFDEAFSGLDKQKTYELSQVVRTFIKQYSRIGIFVTHQIEEAFLVADKVGILHNGKLIQLDTQEDIYHQPSSVYTAQFIGPVNRLLGVKKGNMVTTEFGVVPVSQIGAKTKHVKEITLLTRPDDYLVKKSKNGKFKVIHVQFLGMQKIVTVKKDETTLSVLLAHEQKIKEEDTVEVQLRNSHPYFVLSD